MNLIPVLAPKYFLPCVSVDSSPRSYLVKFTSDIRIPVHSAPISGRTGCEAALFEIGTAQLRCVAETAPKLQFLFVNRSPI